MNKYKHVTILLLFIMGLLLTACSNDKEPVEDPEPPKTEQNEPDTSEDTTASETEKETSSSESIDDRLGLSIGDTGTVVSSSDELKYEVTLNEVSFRDEVGSLPSYGNEFMIVNVTIKNVDDRVFEVADLYEPTIEVLDAPEYKPPVRHDVLLGQGVSETDLELLDGELTPGEPVTGDYVMRIEEVDDYSFAYGHKADQLTGLVITRVEWQFSADEVN